MDKVEWYKSSIIRQQLVALIVAAAGLAGVTLNFDVDAAVQAVMFVVSVGMSAWTIYSRATDAHLPVTEKAVAKMEAKLAESGAQIVGGAQ